MTNSNLVTVEINGIKMQVDLRHAKRIEELRIGDKVRVLTKKYDGHEVHNGIIIGFEPFQRLPTIVICYVSTQYSSAELKFIHWNAESKDVEVVRAIDDDLDNSKADVLGYFDREVAKKRNEIADIEAKRKFFLDKFRTYWEPALAD